MLDKAILSLISSYRQGFITADELVAILEKKLYNKNHVKEDIKDSKS